MIRVGRGGGPGRDVELAGNVADVSVDGSLAPAQCRSIAAIQMLFGEGQQQVAPLHAITALDKPLRAPEPDVASRSRSSASSGVA